MNDSIETSTIRSKAINYTCFESLISAFACNFVLTN